MPYTKTQLSTTSRPGQSRPLQWIAFSAATALYLIPSAFLLRHYLQPAFDLAIYDQTLWLIFNGEGFNTIIASHIFGIHFSPILILISPLSIVPGGAYPELIFQALMIASGVFPAARLALGLGRNPTWFMMAYALHPAIVGGSWYGFRPWNIAVPVFFWAVYLIWAHPRPWVVTGSGLVLLAFREDLAIWVGIATLVLALGGRYRWRDIWIPGLTLGVASGIVLFGALPTLSPVESYFFGSASESTLAPARTLFASVVVRLAFLGVPLAIAPARIRWLLTVPLLIPIAGLLVRGGNGLTTFFHYDMMFVPLLVLIVGLSPDIRLRPRALAVASLLILLTLGALRPFEPRFGPNPWRVNRSVSAELDNILEAVLELDDVESVSISAPSRLLPHLSERVNAFIFPSPNDPHSQDNSGYAHVDAVEFVCPDSNIVVENIRIPAGGWLLVRDQSYRRVSAEGRFAIWQRSELAPDKPCSAIWHLAP